MKLQRSSFRNVGGKKKLKGRGAHEGGKRKCPIHCRRHTRRTRRTLRKSLKHHKKSMKHHKKSMKHHKKSKKHQKKSMKRNSRKGGAASVRDNTNITSEDANLAYQIGIGDHVDIITGDSERFDTLPPSHTPYKKSVA